MIADLLSSAVPVASDILERTASTPRVQQIVSLSLAPAFLLAAIGAIMNVLVSRMIWIANRIERIDDRIEDGRTDPQEIGHRLFERALAFACNHGVIERFEGDVFPPGIAEDHAHPIFVAEGERSGRMRIGRGRWLRQNALQQFSPAIHVSFAETGEAERGVFGS